MIRFSCPACSTMMESADKFAGQKGACPKCGQKILIPTPPKVQPSNKTKLGQLEEPSIGVQSLPTATHASATVPPPLPAGEGQAEQSLGRKHSGLGIGSFLIARVIGGMDLIFLFMIAVNFLTKRGVPFREMLRDVMVTGGVALYCTNCLTLPLCLIGLGLGITGLVAQKEHNPLFAWIGLAGNGVAILIGIAFYVLISVLGAAAPPPQPMWH